VLILALTNVWRKLTMKCPHCLENYFEEWKELYCRPGEAYLSDGDGEWMLEYCRCPQCMRVVIQLTQMVMVPVEPGGPKLRTLKAIELVRPKSFARATLPSEVPVTFANDYREAWHVLDASPKASAALSRRCLQRLLVDVGGTKGRDLSDQIQDILDSKVLPTYLAEEIDAVRHLGNFAVHPNKSQNTGEIIEVEPGEAEWTLDILENLFDFYFVQPARLKSKRDSLNQKLRDTCKPPMK
jgi:hypothetical protein